MSIFPEYKAPFWLPNGHFQTIYPSLFRQLPVPNYHRTRISTPDEDFLDLDFSYAYTPKPSTRLVVLSHGLEGDSYRPYIVGMVQYLNTLGFDCLAWNYRSCSGEINRKLRFYHSGATDDLHTVLSYCATLAYQRISLVGFSLGGNLSLKYLGEQGKNAKIHSAVVFSVPMHLSSSSSVMEGWQDKLYTLRFNRSLSKKIRAKARIMPKAIDISPLKSIQTLRDFDNAYTSKLHGFKDAEDYYQQNSAVFFLDGIACPTLIVNALNDPFLSPLCFPSVINNPLVALEAPSEGGHCGFFQRDYAGTLWSERRAGVFFSEV